MTKKPDLLCSYWTIASGAEPHTDHEFSPVDFKERVEIISKLGFKGMGIWHADLQHALKKRSLKEMKKILDDNGIVHIELEFLMDWFKDGEEKKQSDIMKKLLLDAAEAFRAHHVKVGEFTKNNCPLPRMTEAFAALCKDGAQAGTKIGYEMMPFSNIDSVEKATELVKGAGAKNGGICYDLWHIAKLKISYDKVAATPQQYITSIEINDGKHECSWTLHEDTINHRLLCGEGEFHPKEFVAKMLKAGYDGPWGIEVLNEDLRKLSVTDVARKAFRTTFAQFPA